MITFGIGMYKDYVTPNMRPAVTALIESTKIETEFSRLDYISSADQRHSYRFKAATRKGSSLEFVAYTLWPKHLKTENYHGRHPAELVRQVLIASLNGRTCVVDLAGFVRESPPQGEVPPTIRDDW